MQERGVLGLAFGKAAGFFYAVVASVVANLVFAYVLPHGTMLEKLAAAPRQAAAVAPLPPAPLPPAPPPAATVDAAPPAVVTASATPPPPVATASATPPSPTRPGPGSGGLY
jgi:hypothetical protein